MTFESFRFIKHWRERRVDALRQEREHQLALLSQVTRSIEVLVEGSARQVEESTRAFIELAKSNQSQAEAFATWIKSFQIVSAPTSSVVTEEDEYFAEQKKLAESFGIVDVESLPEEFRLAAKLQRDFTEDVRSDSRP